MGLSCSTKPIKPGAGGPRGETRGESNNLLAFMLRIGPRTKNLLLGTATPIQTEAAELWDLMRILNAGADFVLGRETLSHWVDWHKALPVLKDKFDIFGGLPDTIEDDWIESVEKLEAMMDQYIHLRQKGRDVFELRYKETIDPDKNRWELCSRVLARKDVVEKLSESW